ncbi:hypothetical protein CSE16_05200 [Solibacillus sp. R5-41]|uniref:DUF1835 domain-containing protein n=1 Tax=Solibacillus sp. R5-41 TaxID=2048654 RepID=UPI000C1282E6|nr:DUF1835 domain-containing protein [Solibacillus sp. R5-41]ATP39495.1 hypothetical protein CSE16_05200 [Solibacillus sp. R5-41]
MQTVHIIFGESAYGSLRFAMKGKLETIIAFPSFFGEGPVQDIHTKNGLKNRLQWLENNYLFDVEDSERYKQLFELGLQQVEQITEGTKIIIWTCENAAEQFGLRFVTKILAKKKVTCYTCNTFFNMLELYKGKDTWTEIRRSGEMGAEEMKKFMGNEWMELVTDELFATYQKEAEQLLANDCSVRTWRHGKMHYEDENRDDAFIIKLAKMLHSEIQDEKTWLNAARLIGQVLGGSEHDISDSWINYRVHKLIEQGFFQYEGDLSEIRKYKVKLNDM